MFRQSTSGFDRLLEKATSHLLLDVDWDATIRITDSIRGGEVPPKYAVSAIKKRFYHENPHVVYFSLQVMESCVKNCGRLVHDEIATASFMEELRELVKRTNDDKVKQKLLEMIQNWGMAFRSSSKYRIVTETLNLMKAEGYDFPPVRETEAMFEADVAPEWADGDVCHRCRTAFGLVTRQHHCRACGQVFCSKCSSKFCAMPKLGFETEVRACESCYDKFGPKTSAQNSPVKTPQDETLASEFLSSMAQTQPQAPKPQSQGGKSEAEIKEEEDLALALALSQSEAEEQEKNRRRGAAAPYVASQEQPKQEQQQEALNVKANEGDLSLEMMRYLDREFWEQKEKEEKKKVQSTTPSSAPTTVTDSSRMPSSMNVSADASGSNEKYKPPTSSRTDEELDEFVTTLRTQVEIFVNRMKSNSSRGRSIANDSSVQTLFMNTMAMHSQLLKHIQEQEDKRVHFEGLQDQLSRVKDARAALDALREEELERKRREAEEAERLRQIQMQEKLELMRQRKQEYLQYQRQLALQKMQEQERELMMRQEQVKQQYLMQQQQQPMYQQPGAMYMGPTGPAPPGMMPYMGPGQQPPHPQHYPDPSGMPPQHGNYPQHMMPPGAGPDMNPAAQAPTQNPTHPPPPQHPNQPNPYNMHGMASALPNPASNPPSGPYGPHGGQPSQGQPPQSQPQVQQLPPSAQPEAPAQSLISFD